jgi:hypothetical protein
VLDGSHFVEFTGYESQIICSCDYLKNHIYLATSGADEFEYLHMQKRYKK